MYDSEAKTVATDFLQCTLKGYLVFNNFLSVSATGSVSVIASHTVHTSSVGCGRQSRRHVAAEAILERNGKASLACCDAYFGSQTRCSEFCEPVA